MILNEKEMKTCLEFALRPILKKYDVQIVESMLTIEDLIHIDAVLNYQDHHIQFHVSFLIDYNHDHFSFTHIDGKIEYLFLQLDIYNILKQLCAYENIHMKDNELFIYYQLPIEKMTMKDHQLDISITNKKK